MLTLWRHKFIMQWPYNNLDLRSYGQLMSLFSDYWNFLEMVRSAYFTFRNNYKGWGAGPF